MLGLAGTELILFLVISMKLCLVLEIYSQYRDVLALAGQSFHSAKAFGVSHATPAETGLGLHRKGTQMTPTDPRDILYMVSHKICKTV